MFLSFLILIRIVSNPLSNVFQKKLVSGLANPLFVIFISHGLLSVIVLPFIFTSTVTGLPLEFYFFMLLCSVFAVSGNTLLVKALKHSDLSLLGPVNSYKSIVGLLFGIILIHEIPGIIGLLGVALIIFGSYFIVDKIPGAAKTNAFACLVKEKGVRLRVGALILSGIEAVFLKMTLAYAPPLLTFQFWCVFGFLISGITIFVFSTNQFLNYARKEWNNKSTYLFLFISTGLMQYCTLLIFDKMQVGYALALFQTSTLLSVFFGYKYFKEKNILRRLVGSLFMIAGSVIIILYG